MLDKSKNNFHIGIRWKIEPVFSSIFEKGVYFMVVLIGLVLIFKEQINELLKGIFKEIKTLSESVY